MRHHLTGGPQPLLLSSALLALAATWGCSPSAGTIRGAATSSASSSDAGSSGGSVTSVTQPASQPNVVTATVASATLNPTTGTNAVNTIPVDFGPTVLVFDANMSMATIQAAIDAVAAKQETNQFGTERYAYLFKPGKYALDVQVNFGMTAHGLGASPDDVVITGAVRSKATWFSGNATQNFWRAAENLSVVPTLDGNIMVWAVSQGTSLRRMHVKGMLNLSDDGYSSGGFVGDSKVDGTINSGSQQQFLTRNVGMGQWVGRNWNMVFVGAVNGPTGVWPADPYSTAVATPVIREKPFLALDASGAYVVHYPPLKTASQNYGWSDPKQLPAVIPMTSFYVAHAAKDTSDTLNAALKNGLHLLFTPGVYNLDAPLQVIFKNTILMGMGIATLVPTQGTQAIVVADVDGVTISALLLDAGVVNSPSLLDVGPATSSIDHSANPTVLHDISCRVGGAGAAKTTACLNVNSNHVVLDNTWLWRADHGDGAGWASNPSLHGIIVNGGHVTAYGLFVEHFQDYQVLWNGNSGATYMYQSEFPYDPPSQSAWAHGTVNGFASYKVADNVAQHTAIGMGVYCVFANVVSAANAIESPVNTTVTLNHLITVWLGSADGSSINHILNGAGGAANSSNRTSTTSY